MFLTIFISTRPILPKDLVSDIQQFIEDDYAKQYFSTHKAGFIFRRKIPLAQMMTWQKVRIPTTPYLSCAHFQVKAPLSHPLLLLNRSLHKDAVKIFRIVQRVMGDREPERPSASRAPSSTQSMPARSYHQDGSSALLEEERWVLGEGISHGELRDEIYCQVMKQLNGNPNQ
jgi:Rho GTPase-activating protein 39